MSQAKNELLKKLIARIGRSDALKEYPHTKTITLLEGYELHFVGRYDDRSGPHHPLNNPYSAKRRYDSFRLIFNDLELASFSDPDEVVAITEALDLKFDEVKKTIVSQALLNL